MEKLSAMKPTPGAKKVANCYCREQGIPLWAIPVASFFFFFFNTKTVLTVWWIWLPSVDDKQGLSISLPISPSTAFATSYPMNASLVF